MTKAEEMFLDLAANWISFNDYSDMEFEDGYQIAEAILKEMKEIGLRIGGFDA